MTPAVRAAERAGVDFRIHQYEHDPSAAAYGVEAAEKLAVAPACVFKTLVASVDGRLVVALVPVERSLDLKRLASAVGGKRAAMADVAAAERATGYVAGGISPLGQKRAHPTVVDDSLLGHGRVYVSGGRRGLEIEMGPADLLALLKAIPAPIAR
jgi:Cys-tRNA(Pro)/Cys-tRNA(Cys) deacylase